MPMTLTDCAGDPPVPWAWRAAGYTRGVDAELHRVRYHRNDPTTESETPVPLRSILCHFFSEGLLWTVNAPNFSRDLDDWLDVEVATMVVQSGEDGTLANEAKPSGTGWCKE